MGQKEIIYDFGSNNGCNLAYYLKKADKVVAVEANPLFVGPGVTVGHMAIVGARAVVVKDVKASEIVAGNPARVIGRR